MPTPEETAQAWWAKQDAQREEQERDSRAGTLETDGSSYNEFHDAFTRASTAPLRSAYRETIFSLPGRIQVLIYDKRGEQTEPFIIPEGAQYARHIERGVSSTKRMVVFWWRESSCDRRLVFECRSGQYVCVKRVGFTVNPSSARSRFGRPQRHSLRLG